MSFDAPVSGYVESHKPVRNSTIWWCTMLLDGLLDRNSETRLLVRREPRRSGTSSIAARSSGSVAVSQSDRVFVFGPFRLAVAERLLKRGDQTLMIGGRAFDLLVTLVERAGEVVSDRELIARAWPDVSVETSNLRVQISALRKLLGDGLMGVRYISNVAGRGYCFVAAVARSTTEKTAPVCSSLFASGPVHGLPARLTRMVGRDEVVCRLQAELMARRFVNIVGPGGVGKTTVAIAVAQALVEAFDGTIIFVDLSVVADPQLVATAVVSALGIGARAKDPWLDLFGFLRDKKVLLVLDNCEHVINATAKLAERIMSDAPQTHILTTSREALRVEGEHVHVLDVLDCPPNNPRLRAIEALSYPAVQLFMERALASGLCLELSDAEAPVVANICGRLDGLALAIELVASRAGSLGISGIAELLDNRFKVVWFRRRTALPRHQTLKLMLDWSYNLLSELERRILCKLSVFVGDFTIQAAREVAADIEIDDARVIQAVTNLLEKSLISTVDSHEPACYRLLNITRAYALEKLADRKMDDVVQRHAAAYFVDA